MKPRWEKSCGGSWSAYSGKLLIGSVGKNALMTPNGLRVDYYFQSVDMKFVGRARGEVTSIQSGKRAIERGWRQWLTAAGLDTWFDIADLPDDDNALVIAGSFNRDGEWCAEVATPRYLRENHQKIASGFFKGSEHLVWAHTHWTYLATPPKVGA